MARRTPKTVTEAPTEAPVDQIADYHQTHPTLGSRPSDRKKDEAPDTPENDSDAAGEQQDPEGD